MTPMTSIGIWITFISTQLNMDMLQIQQITRIHPLSLIKTRDNTQQVGGNH